MPRTLPRAAGFLAALALAACASTSNPERTPVQTKAEEAKEAEQKKELARPVLYQRISSMAHSWAASYAEPGGAAQSEAHALQSAISREVWGNLEMILGDLRDSDNPRWRAAAARGLGFVVNPKARPALEMALADPDTEVLNGALVSLARIGDVGTDDRAVARLLSYPDRVVQGNAALCLARVWQARRLQALTIVTPTTRINGLEVDLAILLFDRQDPIVRANAAQALGALGSANAEDALLNVLRDENSLVRLKAAQAIALSGTRRSIDFLLDAMAREQEKNVLVVLALALGSVAEREGHAPPYAELKTDAAKWRQWLQK